jgi:hypothetical protein
MVKNLCVIAPIFANYFAFYYIIKDNYIKQKEVFEGSFEQSEFDIIKDGSHGNKDINDYLN